MNNSILKSCPFCGGQPQITHRGSKINGFIVIVCETCGASCKPVKYTSAYNLKYQDILDTDEGSKVVRFWNRRDK